MSDKLLTPTAVAAATKAAQEHGLTNATFVPTMPDVPPAQFDTDEKGRQKMPAFLLTAHKAS